MKIAIIGAAGFIGTALARRLKEDGHDLHLLDLRQSDIFPENSHIVDVTDYEALHEALSGMDVIYNLAAEHRDDVRPSSRYYDVNVGGAKNIVKAARAHDIKTIVFTSTVAVYGLVPADPEAGSREEDSPAPFNDYGRSKLEAERVFREWAGGGEDRTLLTARLVATFGPGNRGNIYTLMDQIARRKFVMIGNGKNRKSIAYVENVAEFLARGLDLPSGYHLYNYADKPDLTARALVGKIRKAFGLKATGFKLPYAAGLLGGWGFDALSWLTGRTFPVSAVRVKKFCADTVVNADKLKETGFTAPRALEEGLEKMIEEDFLKYKNRQ